MADGTSHAPIAEVIDAWAIPDACIPRETIKKCFDATVDLNLAEFTPAFFEQLFAYKRGVAKSATPSGYRSAIKDLYRLKRIALPLEYGDYIKQLYYGVKHLEAEQNQSRSPKNSSNQPLLFSLYKDLCSSTRTRNDGGFTYFLESHVPNFVGSNSPDTALVVKG
ncbi:hypothetical protein JG687_00017930 [Phytophthora cactorum]|uniref:Uncharacterized protein n=1 Tax=Phytophthora cactorum TaxID=29920 RepID=A0A8T1TRY7_9STRA|nr:hypothetical protein JG687_00017930 [Phytophthora cactorum]